MSDRELLELAAKAAGIDHINTHADGLIYAHDEACSNPTRWNPITNDGDALRLAVKLGLRVDTRSVAGTDFRRGTGVSFHETTHFTRDFWSYHGDDENAATRRAIVRAAAEVGRAVTTPSPIGSKDGRE